MYTLMLIKVANMQDLSHVYVAHLYRIGNLNLKPGLHGNICLESIKYLKHDEWLTCDRGME